MEEERQSALVFLLGKTHGQRSLARKLEWVAFSLEKYLRLKTNPAFKTSTELTVGRYKIFQNIKENIDNYDF